jgi:hypothetical protein
MKCKRQPQRAYSGGHESAADDLEHAEDNYLNPRVEFGPGLSGHGRMIRQEALTSQMFTPNTMPASATRSTAASARLSSDVLALSALKEGTPINCADNLGGSKSGRSARAADNVRQSRREKSKSAR